MSIRAFSGLVAAVVITGALLCGCDRSGSSYDSTRDSALGRGAGEQTVKLLVNKGRVEIITPAISSKIPSFEKELQCFKATIEKEGITVASVEKFQLTPLQQIESGNMVPKEQLLKLTETQSQVDAFILFCGLPDLGDQDHAALKHSGAKIIVVSAYQKNLPSLLKAGLIDMAIVPRPDQPAASSEKGQSSNELFGSEYLVLTPNTVSNLAEALN